MELINDPMYSDDSLPSCVHIMAMCCGPIIAWMEKVSKLGDLLVALPAVDGPQIQLIKGEYKFHKEQIDLLFPGPISDALKMSKGEAPNCQTRRLQMEDHTHFVFRYLGIDPKSSPFYQDYKRLQSHAADILTYATWKNQILLSFPPTIDSEEPHIYNIDKILDSSPEYAISLLMPNSPPNPEPETEPDDSVLPVSIPFGVSFSFNDSFSYS